MSPPPAAGSCLLPIRSIPSDPQVAPPTSSKAEPPPHVPRSTPPVVSSPSILIWNRLRLGFELVGVAVFRSVCVAPPLPGPRTAATRPVCGTMWRDFYWQVYDAGLWFLGDFMGDGGSGCSMWRPCRWITTGTRPRTWTHSTPPSSPTGTHSARALHALLPHHAASRRRPYAQPWW